MAMKEGKVNFHYRSMLGYQRGADGKPEIVPEEAEVVRRIYRRYLDGCSEGQIQRELTQDGIATAKGVKAWSHQIVHNILTNEKYAGDALLQKTFTTDCISKKVKKNTGELPQYYIKDNHPCYHPAGHLPAGTGGDGTADQQAKDSAEKRKNRTGQVFRQVCAQ